MIGPRGFLVPAGTGRPTRVQVADATFKAVGDDTEGAFTILEYVVSRDIPPHVHAHEHQTIYMLDGSVRVRVGNDEFTAGVGDFVFMPRGLPHSLSALKRRAAAPPDRFQPERLRALHGGSDGGPRRRARPQLLGGRRSAREVRVDAHVGLPRRRWWPDEA